MRCLIDFKIGSTIFLFNGKKNCGSNILWVVIVSAEIIWKILRHIRCIILNAWNSNEKGLEESQWKRILLQYSLSEFPQASVSKRGLVRSNRPFPSSPTPRFQSEAKCEMICYSHANKTHFHHVLKVRVFGTRKWRVTVWTRPNTLTGLNAT